MTKLFQICQNTPKKEIWEAKYQIKESKSYKMAPYKLKDAKN